MLSPNDFKDCRARINLSKNKSRGATKYSDILKTQRKEQKLRKLKFQLGRHSPKQIEHQMPLLSNVANANSPSASHAHRFEPFRQFPPSPPLALSQDPEPCSSTDAALDLSLRR